MSEPSRVKRTEIWRIENGKWDPLRTWPLNNVIGPQCHQQQSKKAKGWPPRSLLMLAAAGPERSVASAQHRWAGRDPAPPVGHIMQRRDMTRSQAQGESAWRLGKAACPELSPHWVRMCGRWRSSLTPDLSPRLPAFHLLGHPRRWDAILEKHSEGKGGD